MTEKRTISEKAMANRLVTICQIVVSTVLTLAYILEIVKGTKGVGYSLLLIGLVIIPAVGGAVIYRTKPESVAIRYIIAIGYGLFYTVALFTAGNVLMFSYVLPMLVAVSVYQDKGYSLKIAVVVIVENAVAIAIALVKNGMSVESLAFYEIQMAVVIMITLFAYLTAKVMESINQKKMQEISGAKSQSDDLLNHVLSTSQSMEQMIAAMSDKVNQLGVSIGNTKTAMEELSGGATDTAEAVQNQLSQTEAIQAKVEQVKNVSDSIAVSMGDTERAIQVGNSNIKELVRQVALTEKTNSEVANELRTLREYMEKMYSIIEIINNITSETSLLSLNASIEAARAGEAGRGFAVVASEISGLANQTQEATVNIEELIRNVSSELEKVVESIEGMIHQVDQQNISVNETAGSFQTIEHNTASIGRHSKSLTVIVDELEGANAEIMESIQTISAISQQVAAHTNTTTTTCEENESTVAEIICQSDELKEMAEKLSV